MTNTSWSTVYKRARFDRATLHSTTYVTKVRLPQSGMRHLVNAYEVEAGTV